MATNATWTVIFVDKMIVKNTGAEKGTHYVINDDPFWSQSKFSNIWAIQYGSDPASDEVEHKDSTPHTNYDVGSLGDFSEFINRWDAAHLTQLQSNWDNDNVEGESADDKISRLGARPTSYSS